MVIKKEHATTGVDELDNTCDVSHNRPAHRADILANWVDNCKAKSARLGWGDEASR